MRSRSTPPRAVVFDRDGVLTRFDLPSLRAFFEPILPLSVAEIGGRWLAHCSRATAPRDAEEERVYWSLFWNALADELDLAPDTRARLLDFDYLTALRPHADARPALLAARERGLRVGVLSNFPLASIEASLTATGLADLIDVFCCASVVGASKPAPEAYQEVLRQLSVEPEDCLFFDDEPECVEGARAVGMRSYLVARGGQTDLARGVVEGLDAIDALIAPALLV